MVMVGEYELREDRSYWNGGEKGQGNTWAKLESDGKIRVGMTQLAGKISGAIRFIKIKPQGTVIEQGEAVATLETGKWIGPLEAPVSGTIDEINRNLRRNLKALNDNPYDDGWIAILKPSNPEEMNTLLTGEAAVDWYKEEIEKRTEKSNSMERNRIY